MPACPECASEVADIDIYCPYCGISLRPAELAAVPEDPLAQTIVTSVSQLPIPPAVEPQPVVLEPIVHAEAPDEVPATEPVAPAAFPDEPVSEIHVESPESEDPVEGPGEIPALEPNLKPEPAPIDFESTLHDHPVPIEEVSPPAESTSQEAEQEESAYAGSIDIISDDQAQSPEAPAEAPQLEPAHDQVAEPTEPPVPTLLAEKVDDSKAEEAVEAPILLTAVDQAEVNEPQAPTSGDGAGVQDPIQPPSDAGTSAISGGSDKGSKPRLQILSGGTVLNNRYEIIKKIGGGGMGAVYLSNDRNLGGVQRAVKEMVQAHIEDAQQTKAIDDFRRESMILSSLDHPSIPTIYDYFFDTSEGRFYLVMKYISGGDLAGRLRAAQEGRIDELTVAEWGFQIADVLSYLHNLPQRIVYRDLKPSNVMLDGSTGKIMLIDFGIARSVNQIEERGVTAVGTMGYAPPELFSGNVEPRSDIYSLGSTMFHLMTGADPQNNPLLIFDFEKNPRPRQINPRLSDQIEKILMRCVEYSADKRFANAADLRDALGQHADDLRAGRVSFGVGAVPVAVGLDDQTVFCGFCGQRIVAADMFCAFCGARQPLAQNAPPPTASVQFANPNRQVRTARLVVDGTTDLEAPVYPIEKNDNLLGRRDPMSNIFPEVDLSKFDPQTKISRRHARIIHDGADFMIEDLGSSNGTTVLSSASGNLRLRPNQPHRLTNGDRIKLGDTTLHFWVG